MPRGDKSAYTDKQKRKAEHIEEGEKKRGRSSKTAARIAWATVNKQDGGGKKAGGGRKRTSTAKKKTKSTTTTRKRKASTTTRRRR